MKITVEYITGSLFGDGKEPTYGTKDFSNTVDYHAWVAMMESFDAMDEIVSTVWDCRG